MVHWIYIGGIEESQSPRAGAKVLSIFLNAPHLQKFSSKGWTSSYEHILCLPTISASSLASIHTRITPESDGIFPILNNLRNLRALSSMCTMLISAQMMRRTCAIVNWGRKRKIRLI
jgi:hypothetical protein